MTVVVPEEVVDGTGAAMQDPVPLVVEPRGAAAEMKEERSGRNRRDSDHDPRHELS